MKKLFKKSIACLIAVLMIFSTVPMVVFATVDINVKTGVSIAGYENAYGAMYYNNQAADYAFSVLKEVGSDGVITVTKGQSFTITQSFGTWSSTSNTAVGDTALASSGLHWHYGSGTNYNISSQSADDTLCYWRATLEGSDTSIQSGVSGSLANQSPQDKFRAQASEGGTNEATGIYTFTADSFSQLNTPGTYKIELHSALAFNQWMSSGWFSSKWYAVYATPAISASDGKLMTSVYIPVTVRVVDSYNFVNAAGTTVKTVTAAGSAEALSQAPANTATKYESIGGGMHNVTTYSWPTSSSGTTITETSSTGPDFCYGGTATCVSGKICTFCGAEYSAVDSSNHTYGAWTSNGDGTHSKSCTRNCGEENATVTEACSGMEDGLCDLCGYTSLDLISYNKAVDEYNAIKGDPDYETMYSAESRAKYEEAVAAAKKETFASQAEVDAATAAIISAKTKLVYANFDVKFVVVDENGNDAVVETKNVNYGASVTFTKDVDNIAKWIVTTQNGKVETKVATSEISYTMIATEPATVSVYLSAEKTEAEQYSKVSFISKNGAVSFVKYVKAGDTLVTSTVDGVEIPFYNFVKWSKDTIVADGNDIEVKAVYEFIENTDNRCNVHYNGTTKSYAYDSFVYLFGAEGKTLALSTDGTEANIITYLNENAFYAPHTADIYVIEVATQQASIGITGAYTTSTTEKKTAAFNCKFYVPDDCTVVEYGLTASSTKGSIKIKGETASARGEYCIKVSMAKNSEVNTVDGVAYLTYKTAGGELVTIYSTTVTQNL